MNKPGVRKSADDLMLSINSVHVRFENGSVGYLLSQRGDAMFGLGGWWSYEMAGTKGTFCIENCVEKVIFWDSPKAGENQAAAPEVFNTGITNFNSTFPTRLHAFLEDVSNGVPKEFIRASGRDALATLEYTLQLLPHMKKVERWYVPTDYLMYMGTHRLYGNRTWYKNI